MRGAFLHLRRKGFRVFRRGIEMRDGFLKPRHNSFYGSDRLLSYEPVHFIAQANVDFTVP